MAELLTAGQFGTTAQNDRVQAFMAQHSTKGHRPLTPFEAKQLVEGEDNPLYIYNVSTVNEWRRPQEQLGVVVIPKCKWDAKYSVPVTIKGANVRWYTKGVGKKEPFIEGAAELVEDIVGFGPLYDGRSANSNLKRYGVFVSDRPFDAEYLPESKRMRLAKATGPAAEQLLAEYLVSKSEQRELINEATSQLLIALQERILEADNWHMGGPDQRKFINPFHRECLKAFNHFTGKKETRPWAAIQVEESLEACRYCGHQQRPGFPKCANCKEIINQAVYDEMKEEAATRPAQKV